MIPLLMAAAAAGSGGGFSSSVNDDTSTTYKGATFGDVNFGASSRGLGRGGIDLNQLVIAGLVVFVLVAVMRGKK